MQVRIPLEPYRHQREAHRRRKRFSVLVWHRGGGKTVFSNGELVLEALKVPAGRFAYIAPFLKQAKAVAWDYLKRFTRDIPGCAYNESELSVTLPNGAFIRVFGADNPDALRGLHFDGVVLDEVADMRPQMWGEVIRPAVAQREGWVIFIGTPKGINLFSELYFRATEGADPEWYADMRRASETGVLSDEELERAKREMTPAQYAQEMECDFSASVENALIKLDEVLEAQKRTLTEAEYIYAAKILGVDVARYGDDRTVIWPRQGLAAMQPKHFRGLDTMAVAGQVAMAIDKWEPHATFVDVGGIGAGVVDRLSQLGHSVIGVDFGSKAANPRFENKRAEMWWTMAEWVRAGGCLPVAEGIVEELTTPTYSYANARGRFELESKDDLKKRGLPSPDLADALALTFAMPVAAPPPWATLPGEQRKAHRTVHDYDPYEERRV